MCSLRENPGQRGNGLGKIFFGKTKTLEHAGDLAAQSIAACLFKLMSGLGVSIHHGVQFIAGCLGHLLLQTADLFFQSQYIFLYVHESIVDRMDIVDILMLSQITHGLALGQDYLSVVSAHLTDQNL